MSDSRAIGSPGRREVAQDDGTTIAYDVTGTGPAVVFVHGLTNSRQSWDPVTSLLSEHFTCVRVDLRGHGESSTAANYGMLSLVSDVRAAVGDLDIDPPVIVGHSLGGSVAAIYAVLHPVQAVVVVDQTLRVGDFAEHVQRYADQLAGNDCMSAVLQVERDLGIGSHPAGAAAEQRVLDFPAGIVRGIWADVLKTPAEDLTRLMEMTLPAISVRLLALHGSEPPHDYADWLTGLVPSAEVEVWDGSGHFLHLVDPERFASRIRRLLEHCSAPAS